LTVAKKEISTKDFAERRMDEIGPHALLGALLSRMTPLEAQLLVTSSANHYPSGVPQNILRDVLNRYRHAEGNPS